QLTEHDDNPKLPPGMVLAKPCKACAFRAWRPAASTAIVSKPSPPDKDQLGHATGTFLHTAAAYYPTNPAYATSCAISMFPAESVKLNPPDVQRDSRVE
ncbi:hypothetical protein C8F01DRAFT_993782, partial [Mycena amicta]